MSSTPNAPAAEAPMVLAQRAMREGAFDEALRLTTTVLENEPESVEALYLKAVSHRYLGQLGDALSAITSLIHLSPEYGRAHQEHGHIHRNAGDLSAAMAAYALAVQYNPALTASWRAIAELSAPNDASASARAIAQAERLEALPKALLAVSNHLYEGRLLKAEELCRAFLKKNPTHVEGMRLLAEIGSRLSVLDDAEFLLENAVALAPDNIQLRLDYIEVLRKRQKFDKAFAEAERLYSSDPENPLYQSHLAIESMQVGDYKRAFELFDAVLARGLAHIVQDRWAVGDRLCLRPGFERIAERVHVRVRANTRIAEKVPRTADSLTAFEDRISLAGAVLLQVIARTDARKARTDNQYVEMFNRHGSARLQIDVGTHMVFVPNSYPELRRNAPSNLHKSK